ncbi:MAG: hypothetical protein J6E46_06160 [Faecalicoccus sp.]|nr:hypothetical protein [Faecalicoccus sp.]
MAGISSFIVTMIDLTSNLGYVFVNMCYFFAEVSVLAMWIFEIARDKHIAVK